ncbi:hypothetical protein AQ914_04425 [Burkholderia pseudomallei]|nr:hypothetical protein AQ914_04425 [Burkholderia pseudomallei]
MTEMAASTHSPSSIGMLTISGLPLKVRCMLRLLPDPFTVPGVPQRIAPIGSTRSITSIRTVSILSIGTRRLRICIGRRLCAPRACICCTTTIICARISRTISLAEALMDRLLRAFTCCVAGILCRMPVAIRCCLLTIVQRGSTLIVEAIPHFRIVVGSIASVCRVMLPVNVRAIYIDPIVNIDVVVSIHIDIDVMATPIEPAPH